MRSRVLLPALVSLVLLAAPHVTRAQEAQPGDACAVANTYRISGGPETSGKAFAMTCQGGVWVRVFESDTGGNLGVKQATPQAPLHVGGEAIIGASTGLACNSTRTGGLRWSSANSTFEMCDGNSWRLLAATSAASDCTPNAFSFSDVTDQPLSALIVSNSLNITGIDAGCVVSVTGGGTPQVSVNGGAWVNSAVINPGDALRVRLISSNATSTALVAAVTVGTATDNWSVTTIAGQTKIFRTSGTYNGNLGGIGGAHTICQTEAAGLGYSGLWRALLSNEFINARDMLTITYPLVRAAGGTTVDAVSIWDGNLQNPVTATSSRAYTGTQGDGTKHGNYSCSNWRSTAGSHGVAKNTAATSQDWVYCGAGDCWDAVCSATLPIYCVQQAIPLGAILGISPASRTGVNVFGTGSPVYGSAVTFTIENVGDTTSATMATSLSNTTNFEFATDTCNANALAQGATCTVSIRAKATFPGETAGPISSTFNVTANNNPSAAISGYKAAGATKLFATSNAYNGNFGGLTGADTVCQNEATTLGYSGTWKAVLSDATTNAKDRLTITYPVVRASDGIVVSATNLWNSSLSNAVSATAACIWTGSNGDGTKNASTCSSWTLGSSGSSGIHGQSNQTNIYWTTECPASGSWGAATCNNTRGLYCMQQ